MIPADYLRIALDPVRLAVLGRAAIGPVDAERLSEELGVKHRTVLGAVGHCKAAGLLDGNNELDRAALRSLAESLPSAPPPDASIVDGSWTAEESQILSRFFVGDRLTSIPASRSKRLVVLERLAQEFEPGLRYREAEVNFALQMFHADYAALRRYLVDEGMLTRADGVYWRTGGRYEAATEGADAD